MNALTLPRLRDEVVLRPFDGAPTPRYVVAVDDAHFIVTPVVAAMLSEIRNGTVDGTPDSIEALARRTSQLAGIPVSADRIHEWLCERLPRRFFIPKAKEAAQNAPLLLRRLLLSGTALAPCLRLAGRLFERNLAGVLCTLFAAIDLLVWLDVSQYGTRPCGALEVAAAIALTLAGVFLHEIGHLAAACRFGAPHGGIGIGLYWCWPVFYAEVHGAWLLPRLQRAAVDAGGVYLQCLYVALLGALYLIFSTPALLWTLCSTQFLMLHTLNPVLKFNGYWLLSDLAGVYNLHRRVRDIARAALRYFKSSALDNSPTPKEWVLLAAFAGIAFVWLAYLLVVMGRGLGSMASRFAAALGAVDSTLPRLASLLADATLFAFAIAMAAGISILVARAVGTVLRSSGDET